MDELAELVRGSSGDGATVRPRGAGSKWTWGAVAPEPDLVVDLSDLDAVVEHAVGDLVLTVHAGARLRDVQQLTSAAGQRLALDPPEADATIGGIVATAASGPRRLRFGTPRDLLLGVTVVLADGTVARSGGKVVKNVAGYDLGKLFAGSFGTLGVIATCTFRLHPAAAARRVVTVEADDPSELARALAGSTVTPTAVEWDGQAVHVLVESSAAAADAQAAAVRDLAGGGTVTDVLPDGFGARPWRSGEVALKLTHRLSALQPVLATVRRLLPSATLAAQVGSGVVWAGCAATHEVPAAVEELRAALAPYDGSAVVVDAPAEVKQRLDVWGPVRGLPVMRRIKEQFDPDGRMSPGVFVGGI
ncbi:MAG TPA: FAD-binding oxidoreductase [Mycobacteriales bacterium]|nr:FAD-binding oxidoreductase [Mycobacteriales bacterium]